jgi:hypothetical protein
VHQFQSCRIPAQRHPQVRTLWGLMASQSPPGVSAAALSVSLATTLNLIFYWRQMPPLS